MDYQKTMVRSSKKTAKAKKQVTRRVNDVTVGTHVQRTGSGLRKKSVSHPVGISATRKTARAQRGVVDTVVPQTASGESVAEHSKRVRREDFRALRQRRRYIKSLIIGVIALIFILVVAVVVGIFVFANSVNAKLSLNDTSTRAALSSVKQDKPSYALLVGEFYESGKDYNGPESLMLIRFDEASKQVTLLSVPVETQVRLENGDYGKLAWMQLEGGDAALIRAVSRLTDVSISHIIKADATGLVDLVNALGGISVEVSEEVDDPNAGSIYLEPGRQMLSGQGALTLCRATNFSTGKEMQAENQMKVVVAIAKKVVEQGGIELNLTLDKLAESIETDVDFFSAFTLADSFKGIDDANIYAAQLPGYFTTNTETSIDYFVLSDDVWSDMHEAVEAGESPVIALPESVQVDPKTFALTVRNGSGATGGAKQVADILSTEGFQVDETGNTDQFVYEETLVIYKDKDMKDAAQAVSEQLGIGRVVSANGLYVFETELLVVVGKDWRPLN